MKHTNERPRNTVTNPSANFSAALREGSNRELDWLWWAERVTAPAEREYCFKRALYINPNSTTAADHLRRMARSRQAPATRTQPSLLERLFGRTLTN